MRLSRAIGGQTLKGNLSRMSWSSTVPKKAGLELGVYTSTNSFFANTVSTIYATLGSNDLYPRFIPFREMI